MMMAIMMNSDYAGLRNKNIELTRVIVCYICLKSNPCIPRNALSVDSFIRNTAFQLVQYIITRRTFYSLKVNYPVNLNEDKTYFVKIVTDLRRRTELCFEVCLA